MPQFRLTHKFARDLRINALSEPNETESLFDDWIIDVIRVERKKVAIVLHAKTLLVFAIPYIAVGGVKHIPAHISVILQHYLDSEQSVQHIAHVQTLFKTKSSFCKTNNRQLLGHLNDFKAIIHCYANSNSFEHINWYTIACKLHKTPVKRLDWGNPSEYMAQQLSILDSIAER